MENTVLKINDISEVDLILKEYKENETKLAILTLDMNKDVDNTKFNHMLNIEPIEKRQKELSESIEEFAHSHKEEIGKTKKLTFGKIGFKSSSKLVLKETESKVIEMLKKINLTGCISLKETVSKTILKKQPIAVIEEVGGAIETEEKFYFETSKGV